jgi:cation:H+ antiporter
MTTAIVLLNLGFIILIKGADWLVDGSSIIARRLGITELTIGLTIVAFGSSLPELIVNVISSSQGKADLAFSNILGSNIANIFLILGVTALIAKIPVSKKTFRYEIPLTVLSTIVLLVLIEDSYFNPEESNLLSTADSLVLIALFLIFMFYVAGTAREEAGSEEEAEDNQENLLLQTGLVVLGLLCLFFGGQMVVNNAVTIAAILGLSEALIGLTIVAIGTSLPELAASAIAARKGKTDIAVGNVIGSVLFNVLWVLGISGLIRELKPAGSLGIDFSIQLSSALLLMIFTYTKPKGYLLKWHGIAFLLCYTSYIIFHIATEPSL